MGFLNKIKFKRTKIAKKTFDNVLKKADAVVDRCEKLENTYIGLVHWGESHLQSLGVVEMESINGDD